MRRTLTLLVTSTALTAAIGVPAWSAMHAPDDGSLWPVAAPIEERTHALHLALASDDDDDSRGFAQNSRRGHDDDENDDDCEDDCPSGARNPAPAGDVAPPQNGLFGNGASPQVQVN
ncbi:hypothetical protein CNY89_06300 [Amaricoccus sp. HAR-UPW-R2A-40]|nr:hypothetical protein CNY89_06300 [Amaricoccus sp. HAR-UPW-R2A-40]